MKIQILIFICLKSVWFQETRNILEFQINTGEGLFCVFEATRLLLI